MVPARGRQRRWPWVLALFGAIAIGGSVVARQSREQREQRYAQARVDSAHRADSLRKVDSARADSAQSGILAGGMVDTAARNEQLRKDSLANARNTTQSAILAAIRAYANALERDDEIGARTVFPTVSAQEFNAWDNARERFDLKFAVTQARQAALSDRNLVADVDFTLQVRYIDRATKALNTTSPLLRHAQLTKQGPRWQIYSLRAR